MIRLVGVPSNRPNTIGGLDVRDAPPGVTIVKEGMIPRPRWIGPTVPNFAGGVYGKEGEVCPESLMERFTKEITPSDFSAMSFRRLSGEAVYGGFLIQHFGHFLMDSTARLWWPIAERFNGPIVFQAPGPGLVALPFVSRLFELLGIDRQIVIADQPLQFDSVIVPHQAYCAQRFVHLAFRLPFLKAGEAAEAAATQEPGVTRVYFSRTNLTRGRVFGEHVVEQSLAKEGFAVVHPESLSLDEQILVGRRSEEVAGVLGSAMHLILFSDKPKKVAYICRSLSINKNYAMMDRMMGNKALYLNVGMELRKNFDLHWPYLIDVGKTLGLLRESGWIGGETNPAFSFDEIVRQYLSEWHSINAGEKMVHELGPDVEVDARLLSVLLSLALRVEDADTRKRLAKSFADAGLVEESYAVGLNSVG